MGDGAPEPSQLNELIVKRTRLTVTAATLAAVAALVWLPAASAEPCVVTVTLLGGAKLSFNVNVPPGTPLAELNLPIKLPVLGVSESCGQTSTTPTTTTTTTAPSSATPQRAPRPSGVTKRQVPSVSRRTPNTNRRLPPPKTSTPSTSRKSGGAAPTTGAPSAAGSHLRNAGGAPTPANPTYSLALPGPAPLGVPNFFIDSFRIPPFLLPIYQAAGIQYDVPWQVLAAINEIETDYGRNLSISTAGAVGWMQFLPSTWKRWAVDANGDGVADPYNPVDAIFTAARYLQAAGAARNLQGAIFAYNHAGWYVQSVLLRAKLIGGMPAGLIGALTGLVQGRFPVAAPAKYADDSVERLATRRVNDTNAAIPINSNPAARGVSIFARAGSPVIAVNDGKIIKVGESAALGRYLELQDATGNVYTYAGLGSIPRMYAAPKPVQVTAAEIARQLATTPAITAHTPAAPATAGSQPTTAAALPAPATAPAGSRTQITLPTTTGHSSALRTAAPAAKERLFADPARPASYAAGGSLQLQSAGSAVQRFQDYFSDVLHLSSRQYTLEPLKAGSIVVAGTVLGRLGAGTASTASHLRFMIQPAGANAPQIDPKPVLDGWKLLEATAVYRAAGLDPFYGPGARNPSIGQLLLMSKQQLQTRVLQDPHVQIYTCGRRDIEAGLIDRRVLAALELLSASGLDPSVSGLVCGAGQNGTDAAGKTGASVDISKINGIPILGHQGPGSITDMTIRRLLTLQGAAGPNQIISDMSYRDQPSTLALPDHADRIQVTYTPAFGANKRLAQQITSILRPGQWIQLINRIGQLPEPAVPTAASKYAISATAGAPN
jgi:hypothetical protein